MSKAESVETVLIVDDDAASRRLVATLLGYHGYTVVEAVDGADGLEVAERERPALVISDIMMPHMDGYEMIRRLRADPRQGQFRAIFYTAHYHEQEARDLAAACGVPHVLFKPCEAEDIIRTVRAALAGHDTAAHAGTAPDFDREHLRLLTNKLSRQATALQCANSRLAAVNRLNLALSSERDPGTLLQQVAAGARDLLGARYAIVVARDKAGGTSTLFAADGMSAGPGQVLEPPPLRAGPFRLVVDERRALRLGNAGGDPEAIGLPRGYPAMRTLLAAPLVSPTHAYGWICVAQEATAVFSDEDERLLTIIAAQAGRIYENGSLYGELRQHALLLENQISERQRATRDLELSERRFRQLTAAINQVYWISSEDYGEFSYISPAYEKLWGRTCEAAYRDPRDWTLGIHAADRDAVIAELHARVGQDVRPPLEFRVVRPDGEVRWVQATAYLMHSTDEGERRLAGVAEDITERRMQQATIERLSRMYAVLSGINAMIVRVRDRGALMQEACRVAVTEGGFKAAWAGFIDPDTLEGRVVGSCGLSEQALSQLAFSAHEAAPSRDHPASVAARSGTVVWLCDSDRTAGMRQAMGSPSLADYRSVVSIPIQDGAKTIGILSLAAVSDAEFDEQTMKLLGELARDVAFGLDHIDKLEQLSYMGCHDLLTGLPNERLFFDHMQQLLRNAPNAGDRVGLVLFDIDRFKQLNDAHGRHVGDAVLRHVGRTLSAAAPPGCRFARINSDTFALSVDSVPRSEELQALVARLNDTLVEPVEFDGQRLHVSVSAGIAVYPDDGQDPSTLFKNAEAALIRTKKAGPSILFYSPDINTKVAESHALELRLRRAIERHEFMLHYQPKIDATTQHIVGFEALIRWNDPERGLIPPGAFIPALEDFGLIHQVGTEVMQMALDDHAIWQEMGLHVPPIAVNVSALQLRHPHFLETVRHVIYSHGENSTALEVEITESVMMQDLASHLDVLHELRNLGVQIAIDDFGTGYSSLRYLTALPINTVKIDRSFVEQMAMHPNSMTIVSTIISLAHSLKLSVCAEGVETEEQCKFLQLLRCDTMQGYYFGRPAPADEIAAKLRRFTTGGQMRRFSVV